MPEKLVPGFSLRVNGIAVPAAAQADLMAAAVYEDVNAPSMFTIKLSNSDLEKNEITWSDKSLFAPGGEVEIQMGYKDNLEKLFVGLITGLEPEFSVDEVPVVTVRGYDYRCRLLRGRKTQSFVQMKDSQIVSRIGQKAGVGVTAKDTGVTLDYVLQHNQTDMEFLQSRAWRYGYEINMDGKLLYFGPPKNSGTKKLALAKQDLLGFCPRLSTLTQVGQLEVHGWDPKEKEAILGKAAVGDEVSPMGGTTGPKAGNKALRSATLMRVDQPIFTKAEADKIALGRLNEMALNYITGEGVSVGNPKLRAGTVVEITGLGQRFSGAYYVVATRHTYSARQGYRTTFTVRRNAET